VTEATKAMENSKNLAGKVAIITGGSRGIGRAIALRLASEGARVVIAARDAKALAAVAEEIGKAGGAAKTSAADLREPEAPGALVQTALGAYGAIDIVVNNAASSWSFPRRTGWTASRSNFLARFAWCGRRGRT
jgi:3-oxoacyl-[acyl-carrier protein] reductase